MSINYLENFNNYELVAAITASIMTMIDAYRDIWIPPNWIVRLKISALTGILIFGNGLISYLIYPLFEGTTDIPLWLEALLIGAGYFSILRIISFKLKFGNGETPELSFNSLIYEPIQFFIFSSIDEIIDPFLEEEIKKLSDEFTLDELVYKVLSKIDRANLRVLNSTRKEELKQWLLNILDENTNTNEERKKNILAKVLVTKKFPIS